ncbi:MAG: hypothetical protein ABSH15_12505 [Verrucomicrobiota bacterium]
MSNQIWQRIMWCIRQDLKPWASIDVRTFALIAPAVWVLPSNLVQLN